MNKLVELTGVFSYLSLLTIGGGLAAYPELQRMTVDVYHWLTPGELIHLYSIGQMAPGPNMMVVASIGTIVAGWVGCLVTVLAFFLPSGLLTLFAGRAWAKVRRWRWHDSIQSGLAPVSVGLLLAGCISMARHALTGWLSVVITVVVFAVLLKTKINPVILIAGGAVVGIIALHV